MIKNISNHTLVKQEAMLKALQESYGRITKAAKAAGISRRIHYTWYKEDEDYRNKVNDVKFEGFDAFGDLVMDAVIKKLEEGNPSVINRCFNTLFAGWPAEMDRGNPYKDRLSAKIKYTDPPQHGPL